MRIIAMASALLLLGASIALAQSSTSSSGAAAAASGGGAPASGGSRSSSSTSSSNPLAGATAGSPTVATAAPQQVYQAPAVQVSLSDGQFLPLYGTQLFGGAFAGTRPTDRFDYVIQPGDVVVVNLYGAVNSGGNQTVDTQGNIFVLGIGPVHVGGVPSNQLQAVVSGAVGRVFTNAVSVYTAISNAGTTGVFVTGDVVRPGRYVGSAQDNPLYFLNLAQGISSSGTYRAVTVRRDGQTVATFDLYDFLTKGDVQPFRFREGDTIFVGPRGPVVGATGHLEFSDAFEAPAHGPMTGADLIRLSRPDATMTGVIVRGFRNGAPRQAFFTLDEFARVVLGDGDHVTFTPGGYRQSITVTLQGDVQGPTAYVLPRGAELSELLAKIPLQGTQIETRWVHLQRQSVAVEQKKAIQDELYRLQKQVLTSSPPTNSAAQLATAQATLINQFVAQAATLTPDGNIAVYTNGQFHDMMLEDGDVVVLPNKTDVVLVTGEVESGGAMAHVENMDIAGYVDRAGGFAAHANKKKFVLLHPDGSGVVAKPHDRPQPGDQVLVLPNVGDERLQVFIDLSQLLFQMVLSSATVISVAHTL